MDPLGLVEELAAIPGRAAGSDAERRAARLVARKLRATDRRVRTDTFWIRPAWGLVHALVAAVGVAASLVSVSHPVVGAALAGGALLAALADLTGLAPVLRLLTPQRATQNVVALSEREAPVRLVLTANVDAPRGALLDRGAGARAWARLHLPHPLALAIASLAAVGAVAVARIAGAGGQAPAIAQLVPTIVLMLAIAAFVDAAVASPAPGANANASGVALAVQLAEALDTSPPRHLAVDVVVAGAGEAHALGMRRHVRAEERAGARPEAVVVLHLHPCAEGAPRWWTREGLLIPLRYHPRLLELCAAVAREEGHLHAVAHAGSGTSGAWAARLARWPAIAVGCLDAAGVVPRRGGADDVPDTLDPGALRATLEFCLALIAGLDADLASSPTVVPQERGGSAR
jgi:hypothetical protein